jgi:hypothetical protein
VTQNITDYLQVGTRIDLSAGVRVTKCVRAESSGGYPNYALNQWQAMTTFLSDASVPLDNNL